MVATCPIRGRAYESSRAALLYQHATTDRDRSIADALSALVELNRVGGTTDGANGEDGFAGVLVPVA